MKKLIDHARKGGDAQLRDILSNYKLLRPHPLEDRHLFHRRSRSYLTIAQAASRYCRRFWKADVREVVYGRAPETGEVNYKRPPIRIGYIMLCSELRRQG